MKHHKVNLARELALAKSLLGTLSRPALKTLKSLIDENAFSVARGDLTITHAGVCNLFANEVALPTRTFWTPSTLY